MRTSLLIISLLWTFSFEAQEFRVIEATSQKWAAGIAQGGHGVNYKLVLVFNKRVKHLKLDRFWVGDEYLQMKAAKNIDLKKENYFSKNDTVYLSARKRVKTNDRGDQVLEIKELPKPPFDYKGAALLTYKSGRKEKHIIIQEMKELEPQFYP